jgi:hypothetical protein
MQNQDKTKVVIEEMKVRGSQLVDKVREVVEEGNTRKISIQRDGKTLVEFPLSVGVGGAAAAILIAPVLAAVGAIAALVSDVRLVIERVESVEAHVADEPPFNEPVDRME